ncbi:hypothetical protein K438DRAFT_1757532 [Mycena galopus ATCC 62051]|nr:hypothetical protein K438DRAFT_1757532 [Mycena galopus ATCC 62051]
MLIKLTPPPSAAPSPTILFALSFADPPANLPLPPSWAAQLARLAADDLEAPPALHALDRAAAFPALLSEVLFDLQHARVACAFLDGAKEEWDLGPRCAEMLARVIRDVDESGRAEERAKEWQRAVEAERVRAEREQSELEMEKESDRAEREREAELEREYEEKMQSLKAKGKGKGKAQILNSPPASLKGAERPKGRLHRSKSLLMALVASFSSPSSSSASSSSLPTTPASAPASRSTFPGSIPRSPSPLRAFARRASLSSLSSLSRADAPSPSPTPRSASSDSPPLSPSPSARSRSRSRPPSPAVTPISPTPPAREIDPFQNLETPPASTHFSSFAGQQQRARPRLEEMSPRALRRRARSTLVDAFRAHVLPQLGARVALFEPSGPLPPVPAPPHLRVVNGDDDVEYLGAERDQARARGGGYHAWVTRSMLRRAEARMRELEGEWPSLALAPRRSSHPSAHPHARDVSGSGSEVAFSPVSVGFPIPTSPVSPRQMTFEPWSSDESGSESGSDTESESEQGTFGAPGADSESESDGDADEDDSDDGSSVHTPESGHSIGYGRPAHQSGRSGHVQETSSSTTSSYFTCEADDEDAPRTVSHIRAAAHGSESRGHVRDASERSARRAQRERRRAGRAARAEHVAFVRMTERLRRVLAHGAAARSVARIQRAEAERVREGRGVRRAWLDKKGGGGSAIPAAQAFRPTGLRSVWDAADAEAEAEMQSETDGEGEGTDAPTDTDVPPPAYEDVVLHAPMRRTRTSAPLTRAPINKALAHLELELEREDNTDIEAALDDLDVDVDLEHLELSDALDIEGMALVVDGDLDDELFGGGVDVFADVGGKGRAARGRRVPVPSIVQGKVQGLRDMWERRRVAPV